LNVKKQKPYVEITKQNEMKNVMIEKTIEQQIANIIATKNVQK
jgi:hypothetical protein